MKKKIGLICFASLLLSGCAVKELDNPQNIAGDFPIFYASFGDAADETTKTYVDEKMTLRWTEDDRLSIFVGNTFNREYKYDGETGANNGSFSAISNPEFFAAEPLDANYAVYPYNVSSEMSADGSMSVFLPSVQKYAQNSFGLGANTMVAATENKEDNFLQFKNLCGYVVVKLYGEGTVTSIKLEGNDGEKLSGKADVQAAFGTLPSVTMSEEATTSITLDCGEGVALGTAAESATEFWFCVPPVTFSKGFTVTATKTDGWRMIKSTSSSKEVVRNTKNALTPIEAVFDKEPDDSQALALEREALIAIYNALDGDNWPNHDNWCSEKPVSHWSNVYTDGRYVTELHIEGNVTEKSKRAEFPKEVKYLEHLSNLTLINTNVDSFAEEVSTLPIKQFRSSGNFYLSLTDCAPIYSSGNLNSFCVFLGSDQHYDISDSYKTPSPIPDELLSNTELRELSLSGCNLSGEIPEKLWELNNLEGLKLNNIWESLLTGNIPSSIAKLTKLRFLWFFNLNLTGGIPEELYGLTNLQSLVIDCCYIGGHISQNIQNLKNLDFLNLRSCDLTGELPEELAVLLDGNLQDCLLICNHLSGNIPEKIKSHPKWADIWASVVNFNDFNITIDDLPVPKFDADDVFGNRIISDEVYSKNTYTIIYGFDVAMFPYHSFASYSCDDMHKLYNAYHKYGVDVIMFDGSGYSGPGTKADAMKAFLSDNNLPWTAIMEYPISMTALPYVVVVDSNKKIVYTTILTTPSFDEVRSFFEDLFPDAYYTSSDYSDDGKVTTLQTATKGKGVDIVLMGDAYSDRQIADGTYKKDMEYLYANLFAEEPYKSYKDYFNVYYVSAVSKSEGYEYGSTAIEGYFGEGTLAGGNDYCAFQYALNAISNERMDEALVIVAMNSNEYAGTCYMYYPSTVSGIYGSGLSVAYFPKCGDNELFSQLLQHEALGHGFAKLADEYAYEENGTIPIDYVSEIKSQQDNWGWWKNVDFTSDPTQVKWSKFLSDERYANEGLGCFEGGLTYWSGVWRPTDYSIMRYNTGGFNAPSREAIWYRIHKLAYGEDWQYNYEDFVTYDAINRTPAAQAASRAKVKAAAAARRGKPFQPLHEPVVVKRSWKDAVNNPGKDGR